MSLDTHIVQFRLHFYKGDSIIKTRLDLNQNHTIYSPEEDKCYKYEFCFNDEDKKEPLLKEIGNYDKEEGDCYDEDVFYYHTPKDVFFVEYLHEVGDFDYTDDNYIEKWLDESFNEDSMYDFFSYLPKIYEDVKPSIDKFLGNRPDLCSYMFERLLVVQTYSFTTGYEEIEYECNFYYNGVYNLAMPKKMTDDEEFELMNGMNKEEFDKMIDAQYDDMAKFYENYEE